MQTAPQQIPATQTFAITLQAQEWQGVINAMAEAPYKLAAPLVQAITQQIQEQAQGGQLSPMPNGLDAPPPPH